MKTIKISSQISGFLFVVLLLSFYSSILKVVSAQSVSLSISPSIYEAVVKPGQSLEQTYLLQNTGNENVISTLILPFSASDEYGNVSLGDDLTKYDPYNSRYWFDITGSGIKSGGKFVLDKGAAQSVKLKINIPQDAPDGDYYFTLLFQTEPDESIGINQGSLAQAKIGTNLLLTVTKDGYVNKEAKIATFSAPKVADSFSPINYTLKIDNIGSVFFKPQGTITIDSWFGQKKLTLAPLNVIASSSRYLSCIDKEKLIPCQIRSLFLIGPYKARVSFKIDGVDKVYTQETSTLAVPIYIIFGLGFVMAGFGVILKLSKKAQRGKYRIKKIHNTE